MSTITNPSTLTSLQEYPCYERHPIFCAQIVLLKTSDSCYQLIAFLLQIGLKLMREVTEQTPHVLASNLQTLVA